MKKNILFIFVAMALIASFVYFIPKDYFTENLIQVQYEIKRYGSFDLGYLWLFIGFLSLTFSSGWLSAKLKELTSIK
ncbi:MAG: hypothetical protein PHT36_01735 [Patescibacteria group bacterium]|nr:hypothetical protein [Patescibacteria group bacterium]